MAADRCLQAVDVAGSQQAVFAYVIGDRRISVLVLERLARLFRLSIDQFLGFAPEPAKKQRRLSPRAMRHAERLQALSKTQQRFVVRILDVLEEHNESSGEAGAPQARN